MKSFIIFGLMRKWISVLFLLVYITASAQEREFTLWNKNDVSVSPWEKISLDVSEKIHYSTQRNSVDLKYAELFVDYELKKWIEFGVGFRHTKVNLQNGNWSDENRPMMVLNLSTDVHKFELSFSNRIEYRSFKTFNNHFRHRQALTFDFPNLTEWGMQFYVTEESFLKLNGAGTHLARIYTGLKAIDQKHFDLKFYYSLQKMKVLSSWYTSDIIGLNLGFSI
ncbi:DUF2490 domain-containing protein [uncultured Draconibacterium sp.]|uniref:DUF2490 domain-containing protein n=1 Tax=uncultured Draconibacterium sp. TaxID=1573823 RepID=UPI0032167592